MSISLRWRPSFERVIEGTPPVLQPPPGRLWARTVSIRWATVTVSRYPVHQVYTGYVFEGERRSVTEYHGFSYFYLYLSRSWSCLSVLGYALEMGFRVHDRGGLAGHGLPDGRVILVGAPVEARDC